MHSHINFIEPQQQTSFIAQLSKTNVLRHIELDRMLDITVAFTAATRALVAGARTRGYSPYDKRPIGPAKRPMKAARQASNSVVHLTLHHTLPLRRSVPPSAATSVCATGIYECSKPTNEFSTEKVTVPKQFLSYGYPSERYLTHPSIR